jgi:malate permease and related proteins
LPEIIAILLQTILPVVLIAGVGYLLQHRLQLDIRTLSRVCLYFLTPCLAFSSISQTEMAPDEMGLMSAMAALGVLCMVVLGSIAAGLMRLDRARRSALSISVAFPNSGNFGLSICLFAFGDAGLERAMVYFITSALLTYSLGVFLASRGGKAGTVGASLKNTLRMPILYAALLGLLFNFTGWVVPEPILRATELAGQASVPTMLLLLGMQLTRIKLGQDWPHITVGAALRLIAAPAVSALLAGGLHLAGVSWQVVIIQSAMPTAVTNVILSEEFESAPEFASGMVLLTTLASVITLTILLRLII